MKIRKADEASGSYPNRVASAFVVDLYVGLPPLLSQADGRRGTSPVKFTSHFPEVTTRNTLAFDNQLTVSADRRRSFEFVRTAVLHRSAVAGTPPRPNVLPPWVLFPGSFATTV